MEELSSINGPVAWLNETYIPFANASVPVWDLGVVAGAAISEMARTYGHKPFRPDQHLQRFCASCDDLGLPNQFGANELREVVDSVVKRNTALIPPDSDLGIVVFSTAGSNATYLGDSNSDAGTTCVHTFPLPFVLWKDSAHRGVPLTVPRTIQADSRSLPVHHKVRNRLHWWLADREANSIQAGSRALLLNNDGFITETSTACFYAVIQGTIVTPADDVLNSMTRRVVHELADGHSIPFEQSDLTLSELDHASEAFVSSTASGLLPVRSVNGTAIGDSCPGTVFDSLHAAWTELTGVDTIDQIQSQCDA